MAQSYVGGASGTTSATIPTHQVGDLIIARAFRDGNNTAPTIPAGQNWTTINNAAGANSNGAAIAYKIATSTSEATGTWTSATRLDVGVWRGFTGIGGSAVDGAASTTVNYPTLTMSVGTGTSWVAGFGAHRSVNTTLENAPTGMTNRLTAASGTDEGAIHDTNGGVSSWSGTTVSVGGTSSGWRAHTVELIAATGYTIAADSASYSLTGTAATLKASRNIAADSASFALTVTAAGLKVDRKLTAVSASYALTAQTAGLAVSRKLGADSASYSLTAQDADLVYTPASGGYTLSAESASYVLSAQDVTLSYTPTPTESEQDTHDGITPEEARALRKLLEKRRQPKPAPEPEPEPLEAEPEPSPVPVVPASPPPLVNAGEYLALLSRLELIQIGLDTIALQRALEARAQLEAALREHAAQQAREAATAVLALIAAHEQEEDDEEDLMLLMSL